MDRDIKYCQEIVQVLLPYILSSSKVDVQYFGVSVLLF